MRVLVRHDNKHATQHVQQVLEQAGYAVTPEPTVSANHTHHVSESYDVLLVTPRPAADRQKTTRPAAHLSLARHELLEALQHAYTRLRLEEQQRHRAEAFLVRSGRKLQLLVDALPEGFCRLDQGGQITLVNTAAAGLLGWDRARLLGQSWDTLALEEAATPASPWPQAATRIAGETTFTRQDGSHSRVAYTSTPLYEHGEYLGRVLLFSEPSACPRPPQEMQHADRFALVGQLALALAHDISMPLQRIAENATLLRLELQAQGVEAPDVAAMVEQAERLSRLLATFLAVWEVTPEPRLVPVVLYEPLMQVLRLVQFHCACRAVTVRSSVPLDLPLVWGVADQLAQVFLNILLNALDAMPNGGAVTITAGVTDTQHVHVTFRDTGCGMSPSTLARAFEPFFSTKCTQGTGLGLTICRQIMAQHGGTIRLDSTPTGGTQVMLTFQVTNP